jgi:hypothetical protein
MDRTVDCLIFRGEASSSDLPPSLSAVSAKLTSEFWSFKLLIVNSHLVRKRYCHDNKPKPPPGHPGESPDELICPKFAFNKKTNAAIPLARRSLDMQKTILVKDEFLPEAPDCHRR